MIDICNKNGQERSQKHVYKVLIQLKITRFADEQ